MEKDVITTTIPEGTTDCGPKEKSPIFKALFDAYVEMDRAEHVDAKHSFRNLYALLDNIPYDKPKTVTDAVCDLCQTCEYAGFVSGMQTAIRPASELRI